MKNYQTLNRKPELSIGNVFDWFMRDCCHVHLSKFLRLTIMELIKNIVFLNFLGPSINESSSNK